MSDVERPQNMVPARRNRRSRVERGFMRVVATGGIVGIGVALGAILSHNNVAGWIVGLVISLVSLLLAAILWSSRQL
jgi:protein-S-isoprenylcysteine O-methyltransferase Ste14